MAPPLDTRRIVRSADPDAVRDATGALTVGHDINVLDGRRRIDGLVNGVRLDRANVVFVRYGAPVEVEAPGTGDRVAMTLPLGPMRVVHPQRRPVTWTRAFVLEEAWPTIMTPDPAAGAIVVAAARSTLEDHVLTLTGTELAGPLRFGRAFGEPALPGPSADVTWRWVLAQLDALGGERLAPAVRHHLEDLVLTSLLLVFPNSAGELLRAGPAHEVADGPAAIEHAREHLERHFAEPLSTAALAREAGTSVRYLQAGFRRRYGASPMEVLREIRLQRVRTALIDRGDRTVAEVALSCGFTHLGRFAGLYRARFGVSPSAVRRRP